MEEKKNLNLNRTINESEWSMRTLNALENAGVITIQDLASLPYWELEQIKGLGRKSIMEIEEILSELGLEIGAVPRTPRATSEKMITTCCHKLRCPKCGAWACPKDYICFSCGYDCNEEMEDADDDDAKKQDKKAFKNKKYGARLQDVIRNLLKGRPYNVMAYKYGVSAEVIFNMAMPRIIRLYSSFMRIESSECKNHIDYYRDNPEFYRYVVNYFKDL